MSRNYDSSQLTKRRAQLAISGGYLRNAGTAGIRTYNGIKDSSIINEIKVGNMTEYIRYPNAIGVSLGSTADLTTPIVYPPYVPALPGAVSGITFTIGSIIVSWVAPTVGDGPFSYVVTPYLNGQKLPSITTTDTSHRFTGLQAWQHYTFTVVAKNAGGEGPVVNTPYFLAPPEELSTAISGKSTPIQPDSCLAYVMNAGMDNVLQYIASSNLGPTKGSRIMYLYVASVVQAWNWITDDTNVTGFHDNWDWTYSKASKPLSNNDAIVWISCVIDYLTSQFHAIPSIYQYPDELVSRVKQEGEWTSWSATWGAWYMNRLGDGSNAASTNQPVTSANWTNSIIVDGVTVNDINAYPQPRQWTRLTVNGNVQKYLTHEWSSVTSTCLNAEDESNIKDNLTFPTDEERDIEIDHVLEISQNLSDQEKVIAEFWAGSAPGVLSPPLMAVWLWKEYMRTNIPSCKTIMYSLLDLSIHLFEGARVTWGLKAHYMQDRPIQEIRRRYAGQQIQSWNGTIDGAQWIPYQLVNFVTPPFADFPSGHSHFMQAFALTMNKWFGSTITKTPMTYDLQTLYSTAFATNQTAPYGDFVIPTGKSGVEPGTTPAAPVTLSFDTWQDMADQAGMSRLYGGIHAISAHYSSQTAATAVDGFINATWNITV
jgi:hypothetical protein